MDGRPPPPPRSFGPFPPRHHSRPPPVGRGLGQSFMHGGRPPTQRRLPYHPHSRRIGPDADHADPDDRLVRRRVDHDGGHRPRAGDDYPRRWSPPRPPAGPPRGPPWRSAPPRPAGLPHVPPPPRWSSHRGPTGPPGGPPRCGPPRRPAGPPRGSPRWSPPRRPAGPPDDPRCRPQGPPVDDHRRWYGPWPRPPPSSYTHGNASAAAPWPAGGYDPSVYWSSSWGPPSYPLFHPPALWSGDSPGKPNGGQAYQWALTTAQPRITPSPLMLLPAPPLPSPQPTPREPARQPLYLVGSHPAPQPTAQPSPQEAARQPLYVVGGHQAPPPPTFVLVPAPSVPAPFQPPHQAPIHRTRPFQQ